MRRVLWRLAVAVARLIPTSLLERAIVPLVQAKAHALPPAEGLRLALAIDSALYGVEGELAIRYGGGTHPKHRLIRYHDFFVDRIEPDDRVLDIGCGIGAVAHSIATRSGASVVGIDVSKERVAQARSENAHPRIEYVVGDATDDVPGGPYDVIVMSNVLEHMSNRPEFLRSVASRVHANRALIRVPLFERDWRVPLKQEMGVEWRLEWDHEVEYTVEAFAAEMQAAGFAICEQQLRWGEIWAELVV